MSRTKIILSCEHAGNHVPAGFKSLFAGNQEALNSHRGWDPGALEIAKYLSEKLEAPLFFSRLTRLLIDFNRSPNNEQLFSEFSRKLDGEKKAALMEEYFSYRRQVTDTIDESMELGHRAIHLSIHTFSSVLNGETRKTDIGILFDPFRPGEKRFSELLKKQLAAAIPDFVVMFNYPYLGTDDGFTTWLRRKYDDQYAGIELEVNQKYVGKPEMDAIAHGLAEGIRRAIADV